MQELLVEFYDHDNTLINDILFPLEYHVKFNYIENQYGTTVSLSNEDILKMAESQLNDIYHQLITNNYEINTAKVSLIINGVNIISLPGVTTVNHSINNTSIMDSDGNSIIVEVLNFIAV